MTKIMLTLLAALSLNAVAAEGGSSGSEFLYQTPVDQIQVTPYLRYLSLDAKLKTGGLTELKTTGPTFGAVGAYGISDMFSAGLDLSYSTQKSEYSPSGITRNTTSKGLEDLRFFFLGRMDQASSSFRFGTDVNFSLSKSITESNSDSNQASGGIGLEPFVAYEMYSDSCTYGAKLSYLMYAGDRKGEDKSNTPTTTSDTSGGETITGSLFYEHNMKPWLLGAALEWSSQAKEEEKSSGTTTTNAGFSILSLSAYAPYDVSEGLTILPKLTYGSYTAMDKTTMDSANFFAIEVGGRFTF